MKQDLAFFGFSPLLTGEDPAKYHELLQAIFDYVQPADIFERIWTREIADSVWEKLRFHGLMVSLMNATEQQALERVLRPLFGGLRVLEAEALALKWRIKEPGALKEVQRLLDKAGMTWDAIKAEALSLRISDVERIDRLIVSAESRRDATLREIERHRAALGRKLRAAVQQVEDAEYHLLEEKPVEESRAA